MAYHQDSAADLISRLSKGETYSRAVFLTGRTANQKRIAKERRRLVQVLSPVLSRVRDRHGGVYTMHTTASFTRGYDVIVAVVVLKEEDEDEI
jgi:hypothetical protein